MDNPFFRSYWNSPFHPAHCRPTGKGIPVHGVTTASSPRVMPAPPGGGAKQSDSPRVVTIPVRFVGSDRSRSEPDSALKIQKVFRGFLVRKYVKKIVAIRREVDEIEKKMSDDETVDLMRGDSREHLRVNEMLMNLLFKLDSVRGVDSGVRDCRKAVIRKAIALQEALDAIVARGRETENADAVAEPVFDRAVEVAEMAETRADGDRISVPNCKAKTENDNSESRKLAPDQNETCQNQIKCLPEVAEINEESLIPEKSEEINRLHGESLEGEELEIVDPTESETDSSADPDNEKTNEEEEEKGEKVKEGSCMEPSRELFQKMTEENERMMELMAKLFEKNEMQTRMLSSLSQRVEQLEKAFLVDRLRRKKKKQSVATETETPGKSPDTKKTGKR